MFNFCHGETVDACEHSNDGTCARAHDEVEERADALLCVSVPALRPALAHPRELLNPLENENGHEAANTATVEGEDAQTSTTYLGVRLAHMPKCTESL